MLECPLYFLVRVLELALALVHLLNVLLKHPDSFLVHGGVLLLRVKLLDGNFQLCSRPPQFTEHLVEALHGAFEDAETLFHGGRDLPLFFQVFCIASVDGLVERVSDGDLVEGLEGRGGYSV